MPKSKKRAQDESQNAIAETASPPRPKKVVKSSVKPTAPHKIQAAVVSQAIINLTDEMPPKKHSLAIAVRGKPNGSGAGTATPPALQNLNKLFDQYRDDLKNSPDKIGIEGAQRYLTDLGVELDEVAHVALCDFLACPTIGEFEREAFVSGWKSLPLNGGNNTNSSYDTISRQSVHVNAIRKQLSSDPNYFKQVYRNSFKLAKAEGQKSVPMDSALEFWRMFFQAGKGGIEWNSNRTAWLDLWLEFYEKEVKRPVNKDLWNMVGDLVIKTKEPDGEDLAWWKEDGAWPMAIDDFVAYVKKSRSGERMDTT